MSVSSRPNVLLITSDQQHWNTIGLENPEIRTPNLDRLAREGMLFHRAYCPNPTCTPTRASIITGQYPSQHGAWSLGTKLMEDRHTVGEDFRAAGYRTGLVGKGHFSQWFSQPGYRSLEDGEFRNDPEFMRDFDETTYGFEVHEAHRCWVGKDAETCHEKWLDERGPKDWRARLPGKKSGCFPSEWPLDEELHYNAFISERTNRLLDLYRGRGENFFLWASFNDPHPPYTTPAPWSTMYDPKRVPLPEGPQAGEHDRNPPHFRMTQEENPDFSGYEENGIFNHGMHRHHRWRDPEYLGRVVASYYGMISFMDHHIGRILDRLDALGLTENTLVMFTSDHGHLFGHHGLDAKGPFHYEDMIRVPFLARCPGQIPGGQTSEALLNLVDLAPTSLGWCGLEVPLRMTGLNETPVFKGEIDHLRESTVVENRHQPTAIHLKTLVTGRYKLTVYYRQPYGELFDLKEDPQEQRNRWDDPDYAARKAALMRELLFTEMGKEVMPMPRISVA